MFAARWPADPRTRPAFWSCFLVVLAAALIYPVFADSYDVGNFAYFLIWIFMALGLCLIWGYGGMLTFGQTFFFGLAGYAYGVIAINMGEVRHDRGTRPVGHRCDDRGRDPRLLHDLGRHQRRLLRHRDAVGDAGASHSSSARPPDRNGRSALRG